MEQPEKWFEDLDMKMYTTVSTVSVVSAASAVSTVSTPQSLQSLQVNLAHPRVDFQAFLVVYMIWFGFCCATTMFPSVLLS